LNKKYQIYADPNKKEDIKMATQKFLQGVCDLKGDYAHQLDIENPRTSWNEEGCEQFRQKDKQIIDHNMPPACLKVCGNCEYFTVWEFEIYPEQIAGEGIAIGRVA